MVFVVYIKFGWNRIDYMCVFFWWRLIHEFAFNNIPSVQISLIKNVCHNFDPFEKLDISLKYTHMISFVFFKIKNRYCCTFLRIHLFFTQKCVILFDTHAHFKPKTKVQILVGLFFGIGSWPCSSTRQHQ